MREHFRPCRRVLIDPRPRRVLRGVRDQVAAARDVRERVGVAGAAGAEKIDRGVRGARIRGSAALARRATTCTGSEQPDKVSAAMNTSLSNASFDSHSLCKSDRILRG